MSLLSISNLRAGVIAAAALIGPLCFSAHAEDQGVTVKVNVPFDFESGYRQFKAGTYIMKSLNPYLALIRGSSTSGMALMQETEDRELAHRGKVIFHKYDGRYFVSDIFVRGHSYHVHVLESKDEKQARRSEQAKHPLPQTVAILELP
jgi:hypothetical protein